ncbi:protein ACTIVITY OF BC1 COMPLEX KINASE 8, chloroplastic-like [Abrus precatorius]|uniref:Protein ACTIVITY OF BC1 COMPLEX KINASE 8, chloroplastic-like n=1 Tax=Abrus precatorius TaxID=3816 RepID=A0A8B8M6G6_ABRPR|nr:protein ACTIVITY OF BC1 COMPLEX KINASE 8, chloroplastic-like [Abrus precatorius]XP_027363332.1 protein ACTIVITY OF BC1 COMPLEX KINASE 8, chloroplastic-like [Abrus precatorius]
MASSSLLLLELKFLAPKITPKRRRSLSRFCSRCSVSRNSRYNVALRTRVRAVKEEGALIERVNGVKWSGNGAATSVATERGGNGSVNSGLGVKSENGDGVGNGGLVKYVNGNGVAAEVVENSEEASKRREDGRKKRLEEIGKEDAWFKQSGEAQIEVAVAPGGRWSRFKTYSIIQRTLEIWGFVITFIFKSWLNNQKFSYRGGITEEKKTLRRRTLAKWLKESILRLGPTFIKIGQQFSTRVDILPQEYVDQLSELQDQVPPFPSDTAIAIVEEELGAPLVSIFDQFDYEPIAAASLGQVHRARLRGQQVVVKVQRPGLKDLFDIDLKNLRVIAEYLQKLDPKSDGAKRDWVAIYDECASVLYQEIDYTKEAANAELFANNFKNMDYVKVPTIFWDYTTPQILTMEYVPGIKINKIQALDQLGVDRKRLGRYAVESYLEQILSHGFFHADPHPGNIAVDDVNGGRLIFYDFGMMGSISPNIREGLLEAFYGIYEKNPDKVLQAMIQMGVLVPTGDMTAVRRTAQFFLNSFEERLAAQRREREMAKAELGFKKPLSKEEKVMKKKERLAAIGEDLLSIAADQPFRFPATFTFVVRAFSVLDGIGKGLDPRFDITEIARPYALELLKFREAGVEVILKDFRKRWDRQSQAFYNLFRQADRVEKLAEIIQRLEQGDLKLRVRTLESERAFQRIATVQKTLGNAIAAGSLINLATVLYLNSIRVPGTIAYVFCAIFAFQVLFGLVKIKKLDERERLITGTA